MMHTANRPNRTPRLRRALGVALALYLVVLSPGARLIAQQQADEAARLREQIAALSSADKDATLPAELRNTNREFLSQRRAELVGLLKGKAEAMRNYLSAVGRHLSAAERQPLEKSLAEIEEEIGRLGQESGHAAVERAAARLAAVETPAAAPASEARPAADTRPLRFDPTRASEARTAVGAAAPTAAEPQSAPDDFQTACYSDHPPRAVIDSVRAAADAIVVNNDPEAVTTKFYPLLFFTVADAITVDAEQKDFLNRIDILLAKQETKRTDKQIGASARSEGSTSAAEKPSFAELLGFAVEHGSIQQAVNGTSLTLSTTPYMLLHPGRLDTAAAYRQNSDWARLGISATFNINDEENPLLSARRQQLTEWSAKYRFLGDLSSRSRAARALFDDKLKDRIGRFSIVLHKGLADIFKGNEELSLKMEEIQDSFTAAGFTSGVREVLGSQAADADKKKRVAELLICKARTTIYDPARSGALGISSDLRSRIINQTIPDLAAANTERMKALADFQEGLDKLSERPVFTLAYTNKREAVGSDYSNLRLLFSKKSAGGMNVIANGGLSFYHHPDRALNQQGVRDIAATLSFEGTAGRSPFMLEGEDESRITFAFTGRYQRMFENRGAAGKKADIAVGQFKIEVPVFAGMTLPFSVTYANATELVKEDHVRANFGFSLDTDKLRQVFLLGALRRVQ